ncbi:MAG: DUF4465 domain-containing protein [Bacteroidia bacterium]|nr:DUF4465 domain-containing protein [Bacteroidia bacterium]
MNIKFTLSAIAMATSLALSAQTFTLESILVPAEKVAKGLDGSTMHTELDNAVTLNLPVKWDTSFGGYWANGWAISQKYDSTREASDATKHQFSAITYKGYMASNTFAIGQRGAYASLNNGSNRNFETIQITNSTYTTNSMLKGDRFAKAFGGKTGNDEDSLVLIIDCFDKTNSQLLKTVRVILADFRFADNSKDFILDTWKEVKITGDSLVFNMISSDNNMFGMATPGFYAVDQFSTSGKASVSSNRIVQSEVFPNPSKGEITIRSQANINQVIIRDLNGKLIFTTTGTQEKSMTLNLASLANGIYFIEIATPNGSGIQKLIKK